MTWWLLIHADDISIDAELSAPLIILPKIDYWCYRHTCHYWLINIYHAIILIPLFHIFVYFDETLYYFYYLFSLFISQTHYAIIRLLFSYAEIAIDIIYYAIDYSQPVYASDIDIIDDDTIICFVYWHWVHWHYDRHWLYWHCNSHFLRDYHLFHYGHSHLFQPLRLSATHLLRVI